MAVSPLAEFDFDNLPSVVPVEVIKALCIATQERFNIARIKKDGTFTASDDDYKNIFPYKSNTNIKWTLNNYDPLPDLTSTIQYMLSACLVSYADIEKWDDDDTDGNPVTIYGFHLLSYPADAPLTYANRLFEVAGYTSWPDLSVYAPEEVKKWYDFLSVYKYIIRTDGTGLQNDDYRIYEGEFDQESGTPFYANDDEGGYYYGDDATSATLVSSGSSTVFDAWKSANDSLFGTFSFTYDESIDTAGTYPPTGFSDVYSTQYRRNGSGDYRCFNRSFRIKYVADWTDIKATLGITATPLSYKHQQAVSIVETDPSIHDMDMQYPATTTGNSQRYYCTVSATQSGDKDILLPDLDITPATLITALTDIAAGETIAAGVTINASLQHIFLEFWDGDGGFDYYIS